MCGCSEVTLSSYFPLKIWDWKKYSSYFAYDIWLYILKQPSQQSSSVKCERVPANTIYPNIITSVWDLFLPSVLQIKLISWERPIERNSCFSCKNLSLGYNCIKGSQRWELVSHSLPTICHCIFIAIHANNTNLHSILKRFVYTSIPLVSFSRIKYLNKI